MNIHSLHHYLTNLSESEEHYRSGYPFSVWNQLPKVQIHGREMYRMSIPISKSIMFIPVPVLST